MAHEVEREALARFLETHNLKRTKQREAILDVFLDSKGHTTSEEIYHRVREQHDQIGFTTVYRTMKLLVEAGLANQRQFDDGVTRYEVQHEHHDHLVCVHCGRIQEFECQVIESAQDEIAEHYGFELLRHRHDLYGLCPKCQKG